MAELIALSIVHTHGAFAQRSFTMMSSFSPPVKNFVVFIFTVADLSAKTAKFCTMRKFPAIRYFSLIMV